MEMRIGILAASVFSISTVAFGQTKQMTYVYEQPMEGVYYQGWYVLDLGETGDETLDVYVVGEGKMGDFAGVLDVNCVKTTLSKWKATGGFLTEDRVPSRAIIAIRALVCL